MRLVRTWAGSVIELNSENFIPWLTGWIRWTIWLRPRIPAHVDQPEAEIDDPLWPDPVVPWRSPSEKFAEHTQNE